MWPDYPSHPFSVVTNGFPKIKNPHQTNSMSLIKNLHLSVVFAVSISCLPNRAAAQDNNSNLPDAPSHAPENREVTWRTLPADFLHDQKDIWLLFPSQLAHGRHWVPTLAIAGATAGIVFADPHVMPFFRDHSGKFDDINDTFDAPITTGETIVLPASLLVAGYLRHDPYQVSTAILAGEAYADSAIVDLGIKAVTRRKRPSDVPPGASFNDTFFAGGKSPFKGSAFPSGHAAGAFSVATVVATRYRSHRWVPYAAYGFATLVSFSRVTTSAHFPSDVFLGAALGYAITRYEVLRPR
jgi:membrane-associated phospholipid phosphatase